jgi:glycosyltransferase involved in cell wall biosynthesis
MRRTPLEGTIVVDKRHSALWTAATQHARFGSLSVTPAMSFRSAKSLTNSLVAKSPRFIIFSWREALVGILGNKKALKQLRDKDVILFLLVPDHLGLDLFPDVESWLCSQVDGVLFTSRRLQALYRDRFKISYSQILHDLPETSLFSMISTEHPEHDCHVITWIGNSRWGYRQNIYDHKGLKRFALPAFAKLKQISPHFKFLIVDSAKKRLQPKAIRQLLLQSCCLVITSDSEGTCLPLLEAASLGVPVVTFDVGIARELLMGDLLGQIVPRDVNELTKVVMKTIQNESECSKQISTAWVEYYEKVNMDILNLDFCLPEVGRWRFEDGPSRKRLIWFFRWLLLRFGIR